MSKATNVSRRRGRPSDQEADIGRQGLIEVARQVFSTVDPAIVTRQMIAERAGVDPNLIRYYFGNMQQLMAEVIADTHRRGHLKMAEMRKRDPLTRLRARIERIFNLFGDNPHHHKMVGITLYDEASSQSHDEWLRILKESLKDLGEILDLGAEKELIRRVDARFLHFMIISAAEFWATNEPVVRILFGKDASANRLRSTYVDYFYDLIVNGLARRED